MSFTLHFPTRLEEAWDLLEQGPPGASLPIAGGTDLLLGLDFGRFAPERLVSLSRLPLQRLEFGRDGVRIGSMLPLRTLELDERVRKGVPALAQAINEVGSVQLRHRATLGGNVVRASATSDLLPPLVALETELTLVSRGGRRTVRLEGFVEGSWKTGLRVGEIVEELHVPSPRPGTYQWQRVRPANDISQVGVAVVRHPKNGGGPSVRWRIVAGGTAGSFQRLTRAEACLERDEPSEREVAEAAREAAGEAKFLTDLRAAEEYRRHLLRVLVRRGIERTVRSAATAGGG
ncbi:MAG: FAD binding domain-containing protein [Euryarchaeota archaeon]|nr:FAD binding domain-containing protein [Euryarchaeota archaeon]MDE1835555.1 FAD binding domain-containing protein [Euryarchaeota archaeon]MDE1879646.1 FAD binding domain-containing protein [Euryarchaeota archaeon]MDE2043823.1 FAD binding domain-containing protein [Thermoplasmata archaeon]